MIISFLTILGVILALLIIPRVTAIVVITLYILHMSLIIVVIAAIVAFMFDSVIWEHTHIEK